MRVDVKCDLLNLYVDKSKVDYAMPHWRIKDYFLTVNGQWGDVPDWAWTNYVQDNLGGETHIYALALGPDGKQRYEGAQFAMAWPTGAIEETVYKLATPAEHHWANFFISAGWDNTKGPGPYVVYKAPSIIAPGGSEILCGMGLPYSLPWVLGEDGEIVRVAGGHHVSYYVVFQLADASTPEPEPEPEPDEDDWVPVRFRLPMPGNGFQEFDGEILFYEE